MWKIRDLFPQSKPKERYATQVQVSGIEGSADKAYYDTLALTASQDELQKRVDVISDKVNLNHDKLASVNLRVDEFRLAIAEGIERVERAERRIKQTVRRARKELEERGLTDDGLEAEAFELQLLDGDRSKQSELPPVPTPVEEAEPELKRRPGYPGRF